MLSTQFFPNPIHSDLWQALIERLDMGVIVLGSDHTVDYANSEAARLLGYPEGAVIGLDLEDFASLCYPDRLDGYTFTRAIAAGGREDMSYVVHTTERRLKITLQHLTVDEDADYIIITVAEVDHWRSNLVAETVLSDDMHSPLQFAANYAETLASRVSELAGYSIEIRDLARIVRESVQRALRIWKRMARFYETEPETSAGWAMYPINLNEAFTGAMMEAYQFSSMDLPEITIHIDSSFPPVRASSPHLHGALTALLEEALVQLSPEDTITVQAQERLGNAHVTITLEAPGTQLSNRTFDSLPCAIAEQTIIQHGGRIWVINRKGRSSAFSFTLPLWGAAETTVDSQEDHVS